MDRQSFRLLLLRALRVCDHSIENVLTPFKVVFGIEFDNEIPYIEDTNLTALKTNEPIELELEIKIRDALKSLSKCNGFFLITADKTDSKGWSSNAAFFSGEDWDNIKSGLFESYKELPIPKLQK